LLVALGGALVSPGAPRSQQAGRTYRRGWISVASQRDEPYSIAFVKRLAELGFVEGRNLVIEFRSAQGRTDRMPELAAEFARLNCDLFFAPGTELNVRAFRQGTRDTPIVIAALDYDPLGTGHVDNFARPGGRVTGVVALQSELPAKRMEVLKELLPRLRHAGVLTDVSTTGQLKATQAAAEKLGVRLLVHEFAKTPYDYSAAFEVFKRGKVDALVVLASGLFVPARRQIPALAIQHRLPSVFNNYLWAESGGLLSYGPNLSDLYRRAADKVARIFNGARPGDIPVEQPNVVEMAVNLQTAKALGVAIPPTIRLRADRVIE